MKPSKNQVAIYDEVKNGTGSIAVNAKAGSGKTFTTVQAAKLIPHNKRAISIAFNTSIVDEIREKMPEHIDVSTIHSAGYKVVRKYLESKKIKVTKDTVRGDKCIKTIREVSEAQVWFNKEFPEERISDYCQNIKKLVQIYQLCNLSSPEELESYADRHDVDFSMFPVDYQINFKRAVLIVDRMSKNLKTVDFNEMIYFPVLFNLPMFRYDYVFVDEAQDMNPLQHELIAKMLKKGGRLIMVGDPDQAIYGFAMADVDSFPNMVSRFNCRSLPLSVCYRSDKKIIKYAQKLVPEIMPHESKGEGIVSNGSIDDIRDGDAVLSRTTLPLVSLFFKLILDGKKASILGKDIGANIIKMIAPYKKYAGDGGIKLMNKNLNMVKVNLFKELKKKYANKKDEVLQDDPRMVRLVEQINIIKMFALKSDSVSEIIDRLDHAFTDKTKNGITLCTMHKSKGLEFKRVHIIRWDNCSLFFAKKDWQRTQKKNLMYVAITRAEHELYFIDDWSDDPRKLDNVIEAVYNFIEPKDYVSSDKNSGNTPQNSRLEVGVVKLPIQTETSQVVNV